jgi:hypothetical protein
MTGDVQQSEWRRGGDPANPPIDRVGVWERGTNGRVVDTYTVESLDPFSAPVFSSLSGKPERSVMTLGQWQSSEFEWRFRSPLPTEQPAPEAGGKKGDREAFRQAFQGAYGKWLADTHDRIEMGCHFSKLKMDFLESPAGRAAVLSLWGEGDELRHARQHAADWRAEAQRFVDERDSLASQLEEARAWKTAVEEHAVVNWNEPALTETDPRKAIGLLVEKALDQERDALRQQLTEARKDIERLKTERHENAAIDGDAIHALKVEIESAHKQLTNAGIGDKSYGLETRILQLADQRNDYRRKLDRTREDSEAEIQRLWERCKSAEEKLARLSQGETEPLDAQVVYEREDSYCMGSGQFGYEKVGFRVGERVFWVGLAGAYVNGENYEADKKLATQIVERLRESRQ